MGKTKKAQPPLHTTSPEEAHYRDLFEYSPASLWDEDFSAVKQHLDALRLEGIFDFLTYFDEHPEALQHCSQLVKILDVNQAALKLHKAPDKETLLHGLPQIFTQDSLIVFRAGLLTLLDGKTVFSSDAMTLTLDGEEIYHTIRWSIMPGHEETWARVIVSIEDMRERRKIQAALEKSEARFKAAFQTSPDSININRLKDGIYIEVNDGFLALTGYTREELLGKTSIELNIWADTQDRKKLISALKETGSISDLEAKFRAKNGDIITVLMSASVIMLDDAPHILSVTRNIEDIRQTAETVQLQSAALEAAANAIAITDRAGIIQRVNEAFTALTGYKPKEVIGKSTSLLKSGQQDDAFYTKMWGTILKGEVWQGEVVNHRKNGDAYHEEMTITPVQNKQGEITHFIAIKQDVTKRKQAEAIQERHLQELRILHTVTTAGSQASNEDDFIERITKVLSETLYANNFGVFLLDESAQILQAHPSYIDTNAPGICIPVTNSESIVGKVASSGQSYRSGDVTHDKYYLNMNSDTRSELCVPIKIGERVIGIINTESTIKDFYGDEDEHLLNTIANQMAITLEQLRLLEAEKQRRIMAETLHDTTLLLTSSLNPEEAIQHTLEQLARVLPYDGASVQILYDDHLAIFGARGWDDYESALQHKIPYPGDNPNTVVIQERSIVILDDASAAYAAFSLPPFTHINSWMGIPLIIRDKIIGMLTIDSTEKGYFSQESVQIAEAIASQAAIAIDNARLFDAEQARRQESETLRETALAITSSLNLEEAIQHILEQLSLVLPYDSAGVQLLQNDYLEHLGGRGWPAPEEIKAIRFPIGKDNPNSQVIREKKVVILDDAPAQHAPFNTPPHDYINSWLGVPLLIRDKVIGMLAVDSREKNHFTEESARIAEAFASQAAIAIENARLFNAEQARRQEAETLHQTAHTISSSLDLTEVIEAILFSIRQSIPYHSAAVILHEDDKLVIRDGYNLPDMESALGKTFSANDPLFAEIKKVAQPLVLADAQKSPHFKGWAETSYVRGWMGIPLIVRGEAIGYITLDSQEKDAYTQKHAELAQTFANQAAAAVENARLYQNALRASERRAVLHRLSQDILRGIESPSKTYQEIHHATESLMTCDAFVISLRHEGKEKDEAVYLIDQGKRYPAKYVSRDKSLISLVANSRISFINKDLNAEKQNPEPEHFGSDKKVRSRLISPMYVGNKMLGVISAQSYLPHAYGNEERVLLEMLASYAAVAIENARFYQNALENTAQRNVLHHVSQSMAIQSQDPMEAYEALHVAVDKLMSCDAFAISSYEPTLDRYVAVYIMEGDQAFHPRELTVDSFASKVINAGKTIINEVGNKPPNVNDVQIEGIPQVQSIMGTPLRTGGKTTGMLTVQSYQPGQYGKNQQIMLEMIAAQGAISLENTRLFNETILRLAELEAVNKISTTLREAQTAEDMLPLLIDEILSLLQVSTGAIWLHAPVQKELYKATSRGWMSSAPPDRQPDNQGLLGLSFSLGQNQIIENFKDDARVLPESQTNIPEGWNGAWLPIRSTNAIIGVITIATEDSQKINKNAISLLTTLTEIAGNAIHRAKLHERTKQQVKRLTVLRNIDTAISSNFDLNITLGLLVDHTISQLKVDAADILILDDAIHTLNYQTGRGFNTDLFAQKQIRVRDSLAHQAILSRQLFIAPPLDENVNCARKSAYLEEGFTSYFCIPLKARGEVVGVLEIFNRAPLSPAQEWLDFLHTLGGQAAIAIDNSQLFNDIKRSNQDLAHAYNTTLEGWGKALELRDKETQGHTLNVTELTLQLARAMDISDDDLIHINRGALLHDIGKMGIPDSVLHKPGQLDDEEWIIMRQHPQFAYNLLSPIPYLRPALDIPYCHHEKWDGSGYPRGLKGEEIPLAARIFSIIDVWDALLTDRPYRKAWSRQKVITYIKERSGTHFDPNVVEAFIKMINEK